MEQIERVITTIEVAEMMDTPHKAILQKLEGRTIKGKHKEGIIEILGRLNLQPSDFFIKSSYANSQNKEMPCYECTRKGCEFLAHKFQGEKGIRFTAAYINRFHDMEQAITQLAVESKQNPQLTPEEIVDWKLNDLHKRVKELEGNKSDEFALIDLKLKDLHRRLKALEQEKPAKSRGLGRLTPRENTWYEKNRSRIWRIRYDKDIELKELYHLILEECGKYYDLDEAERLYRDQNGRGLVYPIDVVEHFPELQEIANHVLDCIEK